MDDRAKIKELESEIADLKDMLSIASGAIRAAALQMIISNPEMLKLLEKVDNQIQAKLATAEASGNDRGQNDE